MRIHEDVCMYWPVFTKPSVSLQASEDKWGTDESVFVKILTTRSTTQLQATFEAYKHVSGKVLTFTICIYGLKFVFQLQTLFR